MLLPVIRASVSALKMYLAVVASVVTVSSMLVALPIRILWPIAGNAMAYMHEQDLISTAMTLTLTAAMQQQQQ